MGLKRHAMLPALRPEHPIHEQSMIASPCTNLCRMDGLGKFCLGCWRTLDEIVAWGAMSDAKRQAVLVEVASRRSATHQGRKHEAEGQ